MTHPDNNAIGRNRAYVDIEGTIPAKDGDRVALIKPDNGPDYLWTQFDLANRPTLRGDHLEFDGDETMTG